MAQEKNVHKRPYLIGVSGGSASGKTMFLKKLKAGLREGEITVISLDDYYKPYDSQLHDTGEQVNFDLPEAVDINAFLHDIYRLLNKEMVERQEYTFNNPLLKPEIKEMQPAPVIVAEGLFLFYFAEISELLDLKVFLEVREDIKFSRRLERDEKERGIPLENILNQWHNHVYPAYQKYVLPYREEADVVIYNNISFEKGLSVISNHLKAIIND